MVEGEGGQTTNRMNDAIKKFRKKNFLLGKDIVKWEIRSHGLCLALTYNFAEKRGLNPIRYKVEMSKLIEVFSKQIVIQTYHKLVWSPQPPEAKGF